MGDEVNVDQDEDQKQIHIEDGDENNGEAVHHQKKKSSVID